MTADSRLDAFRALGYSARQSVFLGLVALHSGYCLRRQYTSFAGIAYGKNTRRFLDTIVSRHLADRFTLRADRGYIYHLNSRTVYRLLGLPDSRLRRTASAALIARNVMVLDYILSHHHAHPNAHQNTQNAENTHLDAPQNQRWLATTSDKVKFFTEELRISQSDLPQRRLRGAGSTATNPIQFFPQGWPIAINDDALTDPTAPSAMAPDATTSTATTPTPTVTFVCLLTHAGSDDFPSFLRQHAPTFRHLQGWRVLAIAPQRSRALDHCAGVFADFLGAKAARVLQRAAQFREFFTTRRTIDRGQLADLSAAEIARFRTLRARLGTPEADDLYRAWLTAGDIVFSPSSPAFLGAFPSAFPSAFPDAANPTGAGRGTLITEYLPHDYSQFGSLPGVA